MSGKAHHSFHLVEPSAWPLLTSLSVLVLGVGFVLLINANPVGTTILLFGTGGFLACLAGWWRDVILESQVEKKHTSVVKSGLKLGFLVFILSEVMFFFGFFWAYFTASVFPAAEIGGVWPPKNIETINPFRLPYLNTLILLLSASSLTWAHESIGRKGERDGFLNGLGITVVLGTIFVIVQIFEYSHAKFSLTDGIYGSNFYMLTGFHGLHVIIGTIFLAVCYFRARANFMDEKKQVGFEMAAWYWHFVDVVWLFLFVFIYWWGS